MGIHLAGTGSRRKLFAKTALAAALMGTLWAPLWPQSPTAQPTAAQSSATRPPASDWQNAAGGKMSFDVASVKQNTTAPSPTTISSNIPLGPQDLFSPTGGLLSATNWPLSQYMVFAYKLTPNQVRDVQSQLPKWASSDRFDIQARANGNPTKDQFRLMMQDLLGDRFKLAIHFETKQVPVLEMVLDKPGKLGAHLQPHPGDAPCSTAPPAPGTAPGPPALIPGGFPEMCGALIAGPSPGAPGRIRVGARNVPMAMLATSFSVPQMTGVDRPILDKTGLSGTFDFTLEFTPQINGPLPPGANFQPDPTGPTFLQALKEQLGLKLDSKTGLVDVIVVDHVDHPSEN
jgi:uncharacterized protein (TIGR03435 family)